MDTSTSESEKVYILSKDILIGENGIFIREGIKLWKCPECERDYPAYQDECPICGTKKPKRW